MSEHAAPSFLVLTGANKFEKESVLEPAALIVFEAAFASYTR